MTIYSANYKEANYILWVERRVNVKKYMVCIATIVL
jgi:hypothetical protein